MTAETVPPEMATVTEASGSILQQLLSVGIDKDEARREVELIIEHVTGLSTAAQFLHADRQINSQEQRALDDIMKQRRQRIPLQYCLGHTWFMGRRFNVRPGVLIPRSDTEILVEAAISRLEAIEKPRVLDVGTGSGAIAVAMCCLRADLQAVALDVSAAALAVARENAELNNVSSRISFIESDWMQFATENKFEAVVSNPPYVPTRLKPDLAPEIAAFEPHEALFGLDSDGLGFYRNLAERAGNFLVPAGLIAVEVGQGQAEDVAAIFGSPSWQGTEITPDLSRIGRVVSAFRAP
jgi:release factor glutamine methyltransferase